MTDDQFKKLLEAISAGFGKVTAKIEALTQVTAQLKNGLELKLAMETPAPDWEKSLADYADFDWSSIDAEVVSRDVSGPTVVEWRGRKFPRRNGHPKYGVAIIFSRAVGRDPVTDKVKYEWLISFKEEKEVEELSGKAQKRVSEASQKLAATAANGNGGNNGHQSTPSGAQPPQRSEASATKLEPAPPAPASKPQETKPFKCQKALVQALTKKNETANQLGITVEAWKQELRQSSLGSDDTRSFSDQQMARALEIIQQMIEVAEEREAMRQE